MRSLSANELSRISSVQSDAMNDRCNIIHISLSSGTYSTQGTETRSMVSGAVCGIEFTGGQIVERGQTLFVEYDAVLRVSASQPIFVTDEIQLIEKGVYVISGTFKPYSQPVVNSSVQHVLLKRQI